MRLVDFHHSSIRHFRDAEFLYNGARIPNAGQLYGISAECGLKALLVSFGLQTDTNGDLLKGDKYTKHIEGICNNVAFFSTDRAFQSYISLMPSLGGFRDWTVNHRYYSDVSIPASTSQWRKAATEVRTMIQTAFINGILNE